MVEEEVDKLYEKPFNRLSFEEHAIINYSRFLLPKIQELESKQGGDWISVEDRLPEKDWDIFIVTD